MDRVLSPLDLADAERLRPTAVGDGDRDSLSQRAYARLRRSLISSTLRPGHRLVLRPLALELGLSPTPVREALLRLVSEQALVLDERGSAIVPVISHGDFMELTELRGDLEARAAERAATRVEPHQLEELERINGLCIAALNADDHPGMLDNNAQFHRLICRAGCARLVLRVLEGLWMRLGPTYALTFDQPLPKLAVEDHPHSMLIEALRRRDHAVAREAALLDVEYSNRLLVPRLAA